MTTIKVVGVPEHFNLPWYWAIEKGNFEEASIHLQWTDVPEGTGKMCQMLREGEADIAIILTEGIIKDIVAGNPSKIVQVYVNSPLIWGIHVAAHSKYESLNQLQAKKAAISRVGSGSQLMAYINAANQNWDVNKLQFEVVNTIDGAVTALTEGTADYFMWERFTTQPFVDKGIFRRIADCPTPWPCFVIAVRNDVLEQNEKTIATILEIINRTTLPFKTTPNLASILAKRFHQKENDVEKWLTLTQWSQQQITKSIVNQVQNQLVILEIIDKKSTFDTIVKTV